MLLRRVLKPPPQYSVYRNAIIGNGSGFAWLCQLVSRLRCLRQRASCSQSFPWRIQAFQWIIQRGGVTRVAESCRGGLRTGQNPCMRARRSKCTRPCMGPLPRGLLGMECRVASESTSGLLSCGQGASASAANRGGDNAQDRVAGRGDHSPQ